jgi:formylglycine-generating enzyme required for sulfatase activity
MDSLSILFWTLVALLVTLMFAIEAGAARKHRVITLSTIGSTFITILFIMFLVDDKTKFDIAPTEDAPIERINRKGYDEQDGKQGEQSTPTANKRPTAPKKLDSELGKSFQDCPECPMLVRIPAGKFTMGSPDAEPGRTALEGPQRELMIGPEFAVGKFPVTRDQFQMFVQISKHVPSSGCVVDGKWSTKHDWQSPGFEQAGNHPVVCVTLADGYAYVKWLETRANKVYRMLSEAEWEYVARARTTESYWYGPTLATREFNIAKASDGTVPSQYTIPNGFDLYDVHGNAAQLVEDCWTQKLAELPANGNPFTAFSCRRGVYRGGHWAAKPSEARSAMRGIVPDSSRGHNTIGLRVARDMTGPRT